MERKKYERNKIRQINFEKQHSVLQFAAWVQAKNIPFIIIGAGMIVMLLWSGAYAMTISGAEAFVPFVTKNSLTRWYFNFFGIYFGAELIGLTKVASAVLMIVGLIRPQAGIIGAAICAIFFFITSSALLTTPDALTRVGGIHFMSFLGLYLYKDIIGLGASFFLIAAYGKRAGHIKKTQ